MACFHPLFYQRPLSSFRKRLGTQRSAICKRSHPKLKGRSGRGTSACVCAEFQLQRTLHRIQSSPYLYKSLLQLLSHVDRFFCILFSRFLLQTLQSCAFQYPASRMSNRQQLRAFSKFRDLLPLIPLRQHTTLRSRQLTSQPHLRGGLLCQEPCQAAV